MKKLCVLALVVVSMLSLSACGESGPVVLALASSQRDSGTNRAAGEGALDSPQFAGMTVDYQVVGDLDTMPTQAQAWSVSNYGEAMRETQRLADALGVNAKAKRSEDDKYAFIAEDPDTKASVWLWNHLAIGGWWSFTQANASAGSSSPSCAPDDRSCVIETRPELPTNLISEDEAVKRSNDYLAKAKLVTADYVLSALRTEWSTEVTGVVQVDNVLTNVAVNFSYGQDGNLMYASGPMMTVSRADMYPLVTVEKALERLSMPQYGFYGGAARIASDVAVSDSPTVDDQAIVPLTIPITAVRVTLMESNLSNGTHMLLPAFTFSNGDGDVGTVMAVTDEFVVFPTIDSPQVDTGATEPAPGDATEPSPGDIVQELTQDSADSLIGLTEDEAKKVATERGWSIRVAMRDGEAFMLTTDYRQDRVNITVVNNLVTSVQIG
jgi:predicted small lipoprotein YifL